MSRIGKLPIEIPQGVTVSRDGAVIRVKGPKGQLQETLVPPIVCTIGDGAVTFSRPDDKPDSRARHGLMRALTANMVTGVTQGFVKKMRLVGVGYRGSVEGRKLILNVGYSKPVELTIPEGLEAETSKKGDEITLQGIDRQKLGQFAAQVRGVRPPEPYKGKGIRYADEFVRTKAGKKVGA